MSKTDLVWIDMEMSGLDAEKDVILEIATIITDEHLNIKATGPELVIHRPEELLKNMDEWNRTHHRSSGLWQKVLASAVMEQEAEEQTLEFVKRHVPKGESPLCGNSVWQDRRFMARYMPRLDGYLHYRILDVSTLKELAKRWRFDLYEKAPPKQDRHRALDDIVESINEMKYYRDVFLNLSR